MRRTLSIVLLLASALALPACGPSHGDDAPSVAPAPPVTSGIVAPGGPATPAPEPGRIKATLTVRLADGLQIPDRVKAETLAVGFAANDPGAKFECRADAAVAYLPCDGDRYDFGRLVHGRAYSLSVRARTTDGRVSPAPLQVGFIADLVAGEAPVLPATVAQGSLQAGLKAVIATDPGTLSRAKSGGAILQVGSFEAVAVPPGGLVTSYSTSKTVNLLIHVMQRLGVVSLTGRADPICTRTYQRIVTTDTGGEVYCDSTPELSQWAADDARPMPQNHLELVITGIGQSAGVTEEKLFVAAFDQTADITEGHLGLAGTCAGATQSGVAALPGLTGFFAETGPQTSFQWCQVRDVNGRTWWVGETVVRLAPSTGGVPGPGAPRLTLIYTAAADLGVFSGGQFAVRAAGRIQALVLPLAPVETH